MKKKTKNLFIVGIIVFVITAVVMLLWIMSDMQASAEESKRLAVRVACETTAVRCLLSDYDIEVCEECEVDCLPFKDRGYIFLCKQGRSDLIGEGLEK